MKRNMRSLLLRWGGVRLCKEMIQYLEVCDGR